MFFSSFGLGKSNSQRLIELENDNEKLSMNALDKNETNKVSTRFRKNTLILITLLFRYNKIIVGLVIANILATVSTENHPIVKMIVSLF